MGIGTDLLFFTLLRLSCLCYNNFGVFFATLGHFFERQPFLLFSLSKIPAAYMDLNFLFSML